MDTTKIIGLVAGVLTSASLLPQLIKTLKDQKVGDVSPLMFIMLLAGTGLWAYYGILRDDLPLMITNGISFLLNAIILILKVKYSRNKS